MKLPRLFFVTMLAMGVTGLYAQETDDNTVHPGRPQSVKPHVHKKGLFSHRRAKVYKPKRRNPKHSPEYEFYARVEKLARARKKMIKKMARAQYSNFSFFGHKRKPKRHSPDKMKYCDQCGIRH